MLNEPKVLQYRKVHLFPSRNLSSAGDHGRHKLRECEGLVDSIMYLMKKAIDSSNIDNKSVENCVCVLRNLSYRIQEVEDPEYDKHQVPVGNQAGLNKVIGSSFSCFSDSKPKKKESSVRQHQQQQQRSTYSSSSSARAYQSGQYSGMQLLWQPEVSASLFRQVIMREEVIHLETSLYSICNNVHTIITFPLLRWWCYHT